MARIMITGANGQLGKELQELLTARNSFSFTALGKEDLNLTNADEVRQKIDELKPDFVLNCAAYTAVDKAETETEAAVAVNATGVQHLAAACRERGARFIHVSTDYVFDGTGTRPYREDDPVQPVNLYGRTKLQGEEAARSENKDSVILRTSWVYSVYGNNFVKTMLRLMKDRPELKVVADQFGSPTYAADLAEAMVQITEAPHWVPGIYHYSNEGEISWYDFAVAIRNMSGLPCNVLPIPTEAYPTPAKRPGYSVMSKEKIRSVYGLPIRPWEESLRACMNRLQGS